MRRWEMDGIGRENLTLREVPQPEPPPGQVLVEVAAVSLNYRDKMVIETGRGEDIQILSGDKVKLHTATGYSNSFLFTEAFQDAIANLPPDNNSYPDKLINVSVVQTGAEFGGIAGLNRMYVTVASNY